MNLRRVLTRPLVLLACCAVATVAHAIDGGAPIPDPSGYVDDRAGVLEASRAAQLEGFLDQVRTRTGVQFAVLIVPDCEPDDPTVFKTRVFEKWGIGDRERRDGLLLLVAMKEHALNFETGYGLEGTLPDGWQARMLRELAVPRFRAGEPGEGVIAAVLAASQRIAAEKQVTLTWDGRELRYDAPDRDRAPRTGCASWCSSSSSSSSCPRCVAAAAAVTTAAAGAADSAVGSEVASAEAAVRRSEASAADRAGGGGGGARW
jgi:uncharacterized membrane protein YgcG